MEPPVPSRILPTRVDDYRVRPYAEAKSWAPVEDDGPCARPQEAARIYTHNAERFAPREPVVIESVEEDVEPTVPQPPQWMLLIAGAAVAALMGALLGGFMQV
jgi:hypothetical protein